MAMESVVEVDVRVPQAELATLFADPRLAPEWMDDLDRYEPISGEPGRPGSKYRLVPKSGDRVLVATVESADLPDTLRLRFDGDDVTVAVAATLTALGPRRSRLRSVEDFTFKGLSRKLMGLFAGSAIRRAHARHIRAFRRFAESRARRG